MLVSVNYTIILHKFPKFPKQMYDMCINTKNMQ